MSERGDDGARLATVELRCSQAAAAASWRSERERGGVNGEAGGRGCFDVDRGQRRQADHGAWRPRGGQLLLPVGTVPNLNFAFQRSSSPTDRRSLTQIYSKTETS